MPYIGSDGKLFYGPISSGGYYQSLDEKDLSMLMSSGAMCFGAIPKAIGVGQSPPPLTDGRIGQVPAREVPKNYGHPRFYELLEELAKLHSRKSEDYGSDGDPLANYRSAGEFGVPPWLGVMLRANDKMQRIKTYALKGKLANETARDSFLDLAAHTLLALVLFEEAGLRVRELSESAGGLVGSA